MGNRGRGRLEIHVENDMKELQLNWNKLGSGSSSSSGARSGTDIGDHASPNISVIRQLQKINPYFVHLWKLGSG